MSAGKLPEGWVPCKLEDTLLKIVGGGTPSKTIPEYYQGDIPWMSVKDMNKHTLTDTVDHITPDAVKNSSTNIIPAGIPIIATRMSLGKIVTASFDSAINQDLKALFLTNDIERNFFLHWYRSQAQLIGSLGTGTTVKGIRLEVLNSLSMNLPPLAEQKIIAEKLDTLLAQVDSTKARLEKIPKILKRFRQAVLSHFVISDLQEPKVKLIELTSKIGSGSTPKGGNDNYKTEGIPFVRSLNIHTHFIKYEDLAYIDEEQAKKLNNVIIHEKDVLLNITGASIGRVNIAPDSFIGGRVNQHVAIIRCQQSKILPEYLHVYMASPHIQKWIQGENYGATRQALTKKMLEELPIFVPSVKRQDEIVRLVEQLFAYADTIEKQVNNALARVNNLTQSILAKAFRGELTEQWRTENPELISGENSAAALLEKIKAERAASTGKKAARKKS